MLGLSVDELKGAIHDGGSKKKALVKKAFETGNPYLKIISEETTFEELIELIKTIPQ